MQISIPLLYILPNLVNIKYMEELEKFLENHKKSHFLQSPEWAKVKKEWKSEFIIIRGKDNKITGTMSILLRKVPFTNRYIMYAPRGFVCDEHDKEALFRLTEEVKKIAKKYKVFIFRLDPDIPNNDEKFKKIVIDLGYKLKSNIKNINQVVQPKYVFRLNIKDKTEEELLKSFNEKTRYNIRLSTRKGVKVREGTKEDLKVFYNIMKETGARDSFFIRPIEYFKNIWDAMSPKHVKLLIAEYEGEAIAAVLPVMYGNKVWYLYGGSTNKHRNLMPNYLLQFEMIKWGLQNKCELYDFRGVSGFKDTSDPQYGIYKFKKGFNGEFVEFVDEMYIIFNRFVYLLYRFGEMIYKRLKI